LHYCCIVRMNRRLLPRTAVLIVLILPGLVTAAQIQGPCALCASGLQCPGMEPESPGRVPHDCCGGAADEAPSDPSLRSSVCVCGRDLPPALAEVEQTPTETGSSQMAHAEGAVVSSNGETVVAGCGRPPAPPPTPPLFLVACAFLT
jgi:hypothetical protein